MPTNLDRVQTLLQPDTFARVRTLAKHNRRALSAMSAELVEAALQLPKYRDQIQEAEIQVSPREDTREFVPQPQLRKAGATSRAERDAVLTESLRRDRPDDYGEHTATSKPRKAKEDLPNYYEGLN